MHTDVLYKIFNLQLYNNYYFYLLKDLSASSDILLMNIAVQNMLNFKTWKLPPEHIYQVLGLNVTSKTWLHDAQRQDCIYKDQNSMHCNTMSLSPWLFNSPPILMLDVVSSAMLHAIWWTLPLGPYCVFLTLLSRYMRKMGTPPPLVLLQYAICLSIQKSWHFDYSSPFIFGTFCSL